METQVRELRQQLRGQVVHAEEVEVLEDPHRVGFPRAGEPRDDQEAQALCGPLPLAGPEQRVEVEGARPVGGPPAAPTAGRDG